jgi:hypothetical protein
MHSIMLFDSGERPFEVDAIDRIFRSENGFRDVRYNTPIGTPIEADYIEDDDWTIVRLSGTQKSISLSGTSDVALRAALILQAHLEGPLRIIDTDYSFDLILRDFSNLEELNAAIDKARED